MTELKATLKPGEGHQFNFKSLERATVTVLNLDNKVSAVAIIRNTEFGDDLAKIEVGALRSESKSFDVTTDPKIKAGKFYVINASDEAAPGRPAIDVNIDNG